MQSLLHARPRTRRQWFCLHRHDGKNSDEIIVGANGRILVGAVGATAPTDLTTDWSGDWEDLGFADPAGVKITDTKSVQQVEVWQSFYPARRFITQRDFTAAFNLVQFNQGTVGLALGGGDVTEPSAGIFRYTPPDPGFIDERAVGVEWEDTGRIYRLVIPRGLVTNNVETDVARTKESVLPIVFSLVGSDEDAPYELLTNDDNWTATAS